MSTQPERVSVEQLLQRLRYAEDAYGERLAAETERLRDLLRRIVVDRYMFNVEDDGTGEIGIDSYVSLNAADVALIQALDDKEQT